MQVKTNKLTEADILKAIKEDNAIGFCIECGAETDGVEPDAREYHCDSCGKNSVFGAEELLLTASFQK